MVIPGLGSPGSYRLNQWFKGNKRGLWLLQNEIQKVTCGAWPFQTKWMTFLHKGSLEEGKWSCCHSCLLQNFTWTETFRNLIFSPVAVELWGLQSKPLQGMGPAQHWLLRAMSSQALSISEHGEYKASLDPCSYHWGEKNLSITLQLLFTFSSLRAEKSLSLPSLPQSGSWSQ